MKKIKFLHAIRLRKSKSSYTRFYVTPSLWAFYDDNVYHENNSLVIELHWLFFGIGIKFMWENKNIQPVPDEETLKKIFADF